MPLTYCLNVHPGETWADNCKTLWTSVLAVRDLVSPDAPFGLGMRLSAAAAETLGERGAVDELKRFLEAENLFVFTINGFPYGNFHGRPVKESVYAPDWRSPLRRDYTNRLATILSALMPEGSLGTISTVPCSWKAWMTSSADVDAMVGHLVESAAHCAEIAEEQGREIAIALEPEPGCVLETTAETIEFFKSNLFAHGAEILAAKRGGPVAAARAVIQQHLGVCLDTCHVALQFEEPRESLCQYEAAGIRVPKVQISSALRTGASPEAIDALTPFAEPVYLHQVKARRGDGAILSWTDLPQALSEAPAAGAEELRVHFHVPLHFTGTGALHSTGSDLSPELMKAISRDPSAHLEIETYTWNVLPDLLKPESIEKGIAAEFEWVRKRCG